jgi:hypothetical protein
MEFWSDTWKEIKNIFKPYEGFNKAVVQESSYFMLGVAMEGSKGGGWKGALFIWPFALAILIFIFLLVRTVIVG